MYLELEQWLESLITTPPISNCHTILKKKNTKYFLYDTHA